MAFFIPILKEAGNETDRSRNEDAAVLVCLLVSDDFRSGYAKNIFTVRAKKNDYVASKTIVCSLGGIMVILARCCSQHEARDFPYRQSNGKLPNENLRRLVLPHRGLPNTVFRRNMFLHSESNLGKIGLSDG